MTGKMEVHTEAYQVIDKTVKSIGNSGGILVPKKWVGRRVKVLLLEEVDEEE
jgi:putative transposon-encoded protein